MKIRFLLALVGLATSFPLPSFAQQTNTADPELREALTEFNKKVDDGLNSGNAAALAALFTEDAVFVTDQGPVFGRQAIEKWYTDLFQTIHFSNHSGTVDQNSPHGIATADIEMWATGQWSVTLKGQNFGPVQAKGYYGAIYVREGGAWKKRMETWNLTPPPSK
jgi:ketosteroid isomerase-like protein